MGIISVGASLGVKDGGNAHPIITTSSAAGLPLPARRRGGAGARSPASASASPSAVTARAYYSAPSSSSLNHQQQYGNGTSSESQQASRKKPLRRRAAAAAATSSIASGASSVASLSTSASLSGPRSQQQQDEMGQWQVTRVVAVATNCDPQALLPHVIGNRGARINAIMSQAKCIIAHRKRDARNHDAANGGGGGSTGFSMSFQVSADTIKRVDHGARLLRSAIENAEQLVRGRISSSSLGAGTGVGRAPAIPERVASDGLESTSRSDGALPRKRKQADARGSSEDIGSESKRIHRTEDAGNRGAAGAAAASASDDALEIDEFRIRLQRSAAISRRIAQEAARAQAQAAIEKHKYVAVLRKAEAIKHKRRVSDLVVKAQCAVLASPSSSASKTKRVKIEQLSAAHDACWADASASVRRVVAPDIRIPRLGTRKLSVIAASSLLSAGQAAKRAASAKDDDLAKLFKKLEAFKKATSSSASRVRGRQEAAEPVGEDAPGFEFEAPAGDPSRSSSIAPAAVPVSSVQRESRAAASSNGHKETPVQENRRESFRSTWDVPGLNRDLNLVQDYSSESDCKLLQLVVGERQYFYMEPLLLDHGVENQDALKRWILTERDVQLVCGFLSENDQYGKQVVQSIDDAKKPAASPSSPSSPELFQSSKKTQWSAVQRQLVNLHSLTLAAHLLGYHYHAMQSLRDGASSAASNTAGAAAHAPASGRDVLTDETLKSDLFKFILRPIRSSAIESSLLDSLPISLVRETVEHCPEVLNHVLNWREEEDIPVDVAEDIQSNRAAAAAKDNASAYLQSLMERLSGHVGELDVVLVSLGEKVRQKLSQASESPQQQDSVIFLTNQLKDVMAKIVVENIKLQLHKWATVFLANSCSWFDPDFEDSLGYGSDGDRTYDKFTCLQDALFVWHNQKVLYSAKDDLADMEVAKHAENGVSEASKSQSSLSTQAAVSSSSNARVGDGKAAPLTASELQAALEPTPSDNELQLLRSLTPASMLDKLENRFTLEDQTQHYLSLEEIDSNQKQLLESLVAMKALMDVVGRSAPWRTHVKNSNALKRELAKQAAIEKTLLLHQWAFFYKRHQGKLAKPEQVASAQPLAGNPGAAEKKSAACSDKKREADDAEHAARNIDYTGVFKENDSVDVIVMKKLRHELQVTNAALAKRARSSDAKDPLHAEHRSLMSECNALTQSCVAALSKFLGESVDDEVAAQIHASSEANAAPRRRARSRSVVNPDELRPTASEPSLDKAGSRIDGQSAPVVRDSSNGQPASQVAHAPCKRGDNGAESMEIDESGAPPAKGSVPSVPPVAEGGAPNAAAAKGGKSTSEKQAGVLPVMAPATAGSKSSRKSPTARAQSRGASSAPLRMGCSGCRDLRRRCTGCFGCCLHCVCVSCGCRMCCSTRFSAVQKTLAMLVSCVEANDGCKWVHAKPRSNSLSSDTDGGAAGAAARNEQFTSRICGMLRICFKCLYCGAHCTCPRPTVTRVSGVHARIGLRGRPAATRRERRFKAKLAPTQRRTPPVSSDGSANDQDAPMGAGPSPKSGRAAGAGAGAAGEDAEHSSSNMPGAAASPPAAAAAAAPGSEAGSADTSNETPFDASFPNPPPPLRKDQGKTEQEDLFRAARVRMKLQRNTFSRLHTLYGSIPPNTFLDGDMLWQPERIRMMWERKDFFGVLGVPRDATTQQIKRQYRKLALKLHPDKTMDVANQQSSSSNGHEGDYHTSTPDERVEAFVAVTHAYKLLSGDPATINSNVWKPTM